MVVAHLAGVNAFTLAWTHSVEKTRWEEDWTVSAAGLALVQARVAGHGAGMEPPDGAKLVDGFWRWSPAMPPLRELVLRRSGATEDWSLCVDAVCRGFSELMPARADPVTLAGCEAP
jgi:hypothetical protein